MAGRRRVKRMETWALALGVAWLGACTGRSDSWVGWALAGAAMAAVAGFAVVDAHRRERLRKVGRRGTATIVAARQTGTYTNNNPKLEVELEIHLADGEPYSVTQRFTVQLLHLSTVKPGAAVKVIVDPTDRAHLLVDEEGWS